MKFPVHKVMMNILLIGVLTAFPATPCFSGEVHVSVVLSDDRPPFTTALEGFQEVLQESGVSASYSVISMEGDEKTGEEALRRIKEQGSDIIYTLGSFASGVVIGNITDIPIVFGMTYGKNIRKKSENATGVTLEIPLETQLTMLHRFLPDVKTIGVLYNPEENQAIIDRASKIAWKMNLHLSYRRVNKPQEIPDALKSLIKTADVILGISDSVVLNAQTVKKILLFSYRNKIPFVGLSAQWVKSGALYSLERDYRDIGRQCGEMTLSILRGKRADAISPASPRKVMYVLSLKAARHMKVEFDQKVIQDAFHLY